jgi:hypothetical protein
MTAVFDAIAGLSIAAQLNSATISPQFLSNSMPLAKVETRQGMYKEYSVDVTDDSALDENKRGFKTAAETDEGKNKVSILYCVFVVGIVPTANCNT